MTHDDDESSLISPPGAGLSHEQVLDEDGGFWVFGYGSLMWSPGFPYTSRRPALLDGYARRFCLSSIHYRGTVEQPGLVLALDAAPQASVHGVAFRVASEHALKTHDYLVARELISAAYVEVTAQIRFADAQGGASRAVTYVIDREHPQYAGELSFEQQAEIIARCRGANGSNFEYLVNTLAHMREAGLREDELDGLDAIEILARARLG